MLKYFLMTIFICFKFSYATRDAKAICGNPNEPLYMRFDDTNEEKLSCPAHTKNEEHKLKELSEQHYEINYCLWNKIFTPSDKKICQSEVRPVFRIYKNEDDEPIRCGSDKNQFLHYFGYYYCGDESDLQTLRNTKIPKDEKFQTEFPTSRSIAAYTVCFDVSKNKAVWTQHSIETPQLFQDPSNVEHYCEKDISKDSFNMDQKFFENLEKRYKSAEKKSSISHAVLPQPLVPPDHFAVRLVKKTTNHYINRAPLWHKLVPLMTAIDQGIKTAAIKSSSKTDKGLTNNIVIFTKTKTVHTMMTRLKKWFKIEPFEPNIWLKFVYDSVHYKGVMIYVHNTPGKPVVKKCEKEIYCNFKKWTKDVNIRNDIGEKELEYAYCCPIRTEEAAKEFLAPDFDISEYFDINFLAMDE